MLRNLEILLDKPQRLQMALVMIGMFVAALLEMLGIGAIPAFVAVLSNPDALSERLPNGGFGSWIRETKLSVITLYGAALLAAIFVIKNLYIAGLIYAEGRVIRDVTSAVATRIFLPLPGYRGNGVAISDRDIFLPPRYLALCNLSCPYQ